MYKTLLSLIFFACSFSFLTARSVDTEQDRHVFFANSTLIPEYDYKRPSHISPELWGMVKPYLLPSNHPIKTSLDKIFSASRVCLNSATASAAGFKRSQPRPWSKTVVSHHPKLQGYLVKMFLDEQKDYDDYLQWIKRIDGANVVSSVIKQHGYTHFFKVPRKWIYVLPTSPAPPLDVQRKNFILVVEDMHICGKLESARKWCSDNKMTKERLDAFYVVCYECGLLDSTKDFNVPFCRDGKQAFIDLEYHHRWPVPFEFTLPALSPKMREYWKSIMTNGGPPSHPKLVKHEKKKEKATKVIVKGERKRRKAEMKQRRKQKKRKYQIRHSLQMGEFRDDIEFIIPGLEPREVADKQ